MSGIYKGNLVGIFKNYILAISPSQLWFLVALFMIMCVFYWISIGLEKLNSRTFDLFIFVFLFFLNIGSSLLPNIFQISNTSRFILFFYCGYCFRRNDFNFLHNINGLIYLIIHIILFIVYYYLSGFSQSTYHYCGIFIYPFVNLSGILTVFIGVNRINSKWTINHDNQIFCFLKKYNFTMYLFHQQIIYCVITIFNGILCPAGLVATSFIVAFILSALMAWFLGKYKVTQFMFGIQGGKNN